MSIINQVLRDLEKRQAPGAEGTALPEKLHTLPDSRGGADRSKLAIAAGILTATVAIVWAVWTGFDWISSKRTAPANKSPELPVAAPKEKTVVASSDIPAPVSTLRNEAALNAGESAAATATNQAGVAPDNSAPPLAAEKMPAIIDKPAPLSPESRTPLPEAATRATIDKPTPRPPLSKPPSPDAPTAAVINKHAPRPSSTPETTPEAKPPIRTASILPKPEIATSPPAKPSIRPPEVKPEPPQQAAAPSTHEPRKKDVSTTSRPATADAQPAPGPKIEKRTRELTSAQLAEREYGKATNLLYQGNHAEALASFEAALAYRPTHLGARQGLVGLLIQDKNYPDAERVLQDGLQLSPQQTGFAIALARLQVNRNDEQAALDTLRKVGASSQNNAGYRAFLAALLQRQNQHAQAVDHFSAALNLEPRSGAWLMGLAISLQTLGRSDEAQEAFLRAKRSGNLTPGLIAFVDQRLEQLK